MELRVLGRGAFAGLIAGVLGSVFARIWIEPQINKAIDFESRRGEVLQALNNAAGRATDAGGPDVFSRDFQSTTGLAIGVIGFAVAMGLITAVIYLLLHGRFRLPPQAAAWSAAAIGFTGLYLLPLVKYPANPPAIGHDFTIKTRGTLYLGLVVISLLLVGLSIVLGARLTARLGTVRGVVAAVILLIAAYGAVISTMPSLGDLAANKSHADEIGFARASTETPQPITNTLDKPVVVEGKTIAPGQLAFPGFDADVLWKFREYSLMNQVLIWSTIGLILGASVALLRRRSEV